MILFDRLIRQQSPEIDECQIYTNIFRFGNLMIKHDSCVMEALAADLMAQKCQLKTPLFVICPWIIAHLPLGIYASQTDWMTRIKKKQTIPNKAQSIELIEYFDDWTDFDPIEAQVILSNEELAHEIGKLLAFDLYIGNDDRFIAIFEYLEATANVNEESDHFDYIFYTKFPINSSNFGFHNDKLYSIDHAMTCPTTYPLMYLEVKSPRMHRILDWLGNEYLLFNADHRIMLENHYVNWAHYYASNPTIVESKMIIDNALKIQKKN